MLECEYESGSGPGPAYEIIPNSPLVRVASTRRILRYGAITGALCLCAGLIGDRVIDRLLEGTDVHPAMQQASMRGVLNMAEVPRQINPYRLEYTCPDDGSVCLCTQNFVVAGQDAFGYNMYSPSPGSSACQPWKFQIGDIIFVEKPAGDQPQYREAEVVAKFTGTPVVHNAIVTQVPPPGVDQTGENVIVTEALKGYWKKVVQNTFRTLVERYPFGGVSIRRVDPNRFPNFFTKQSQAAMTEWANRITGEPFDQKMVNPVKRFWFTRGRYIPKNPSCADRQRANRMYNSGGPRQWICTQLVAWTIAFPGGLNVNPNNTSPDCSVPDYIVKNLQPNPGDMLSAPFVQQGGWRAPCDTAGCYIGVPNVPRWAGGTTARAQRHTTTPVFTTTLEPDRKRKRGPVETTTLDVRKMAKTRTKTQQECYMHVLAHWQSVNNNKTHVELAKLLHHTSIMEAVRAACHPSSGTQKRSTPSPGATPAPTPGATPAPTPAWTDPPTPKPSTTPNAVPSASRASAKEASEKASPVLGHGAEVPNSFFGASKADEKSGSFHANVHTGTSTQASGECGPGDKCAKCRDVKALAKCVAASKQESPGSKADEKSGSSKAKKKEAESNKDATDSKDAKNQQCSCPPALVLYPCTHDEYGAIMSGKTCPFYLHQSPGKSDATHIEDS